MGLYKRKGSPFWWMCFRSGGRRFLESTHEKKKGLAEVAFARRLDEVVTAGPERAVRRPPVLLAVLAERYLEFTAAQRDFKCKALRVAFLSDWFGGECVISRISLSEVEQLQTSLLKGGRKPATVNRYLACLKYMVAKAVDWDMADERVLKAVRRVKQLREDNRRLRFLTLDEGRALVRACAPHLAPVVITALNSGMRKGEILSLTWGQVDMRNGFIRLDITKSGYGRNVPINETLRACLQSLTRHLRSEWVFTDALGGRFQDVKRSFSSACKRAGISDFRFHDLRHTFASQLVMAGVDLMTVKELLGHRTLAMTLRYSHLAPEHSSRAVRVLDEVAGYNTVTFSGRKKGATS